MPRFYKFMSRPAVDQSDADGMRRARLRADVRASAAEQCTRANATRRSLCIRIQPRSTYAPSGSGASLSLRLPSLFRVWRHRLKATLVVLWLCLRSRFAQSCYQHVLRHHIPRRVWRL